MKKLDLTGQKFGRLTVTKEVKPYISPKGKKCFKWLCNCDCGNIKEVRSSDLKSGNTKSCGCFSKEVHLKALISHGCSKRGKYLPLYNKWQNMRKRCYKEKSTHYKDYGGRGITVCDEWKDSFIEFKDWAIVNGYKSDLQIDRIDNNGNYEPSNCRFVTPHVNALNRRMNHNNTSGYIGVYAHRGRFDSFLMNHNKRCNLGTYKTKKEALMARNNYIIKHSLIHKIQKYSGEK